MARPTIFGSKGIKTYRVQGDLTRVGGIAFEAQRAALGRFFAGVTGEAFPRAPSDADVIEYLARGEAATREYLEKRLKTKPAAPRKV